MHLGTVYQHGENTQADVIARTDLYLEIIVAGVGKHDLAILFDARTPDGVIA